MHVRACGVSWTLTLRGVEAAAGTVCTRAQQGIKGHAFLNALPSWRAAEHMPAARHWGLLLHG